MFAQNSRYVHQPTYTITLPDGRTVMAVRPWISPAGLALAGYHPRVDRDRLDLLAAKYLQDSTLFWKLCDANDTPAAAALEARALIGIPRGGE